jgi:hypothetical protein
MPFTASFSLGFTGVLPDEMSGANCCVRIADQYGSNDDTDRCYHTVSLVFTTVLSLVFSAVFPLVIAAATSLRSPELASLEIDAMSDWVSAQMNDRASEG